MNPLARPAIVSPSARPAIRPSVCHSYPTNTDGVRTLCLPCDRPSRLREKRLSPSHHRVMDDEDSEGNHYTYVLNALVNEGLNSARGDQGGFKTTSPPSRGLWAGWALPAGDEPPQRPEGQRMLPTREAQGEVCARRPRLWRHLLGCAKTQASGY